MVVCRFKKMLGRNKCWVYSSLILGWSKVTCLLSLRPLSSRIRTINLVVNVNSLVTFGLLTFWGSLLSGLASNCEMFSLLLGNLNFQIFVVLFLLLFLYFRCNTGRTWTHCFAAICRSGKMPLLSKCILLKKIWLFSSFIQSRLNWIIYKQQLVDSIFMHGQLLRAGKHCAFH